MLVARDLGKRYLIYDKPHHRLLQGLLRRPMSREFWALSEVAFELAPGETLGILGRNGAGKSTLLQLVTGVLAPTTGEVTVHGKVAALLELGAGFNPDFSGRENARLNAAILGLSTEEIDARLDGMIEFSELGDFIDQPVKTYSSGMYVRLAFSIAIHVDPAVLVVDEALSVGDARFQAKCMDRVRDMKRRGVAILFVSHDVNAVRQLCDRAIWLDGGRVKMMGDVFPVTARYIEYLFDEPTQPAVAGDPDALAVVGPSSERHAAAKPPLLRWGSRVGSILDHGLYDQNGVRREVFQEDEPMEVRIRFRLPAGADHRTTGVAFSFKDTYGSDLVVVTTLDKEEVLPSGADILEARFQLRSCLASGDYVVVVALEDRQDGSIRYFDYIEGASYFTTIHARRVHGRFVPEVHTAVTSFRPSQEPR